MPPKQSRDNSANSGKPLVPTLASGRVKSPITPRLAAQHLGASGATTPLSRSSARSNTPDTVRAKAPDLSTPVRNLISHNITPRSSSRKSRVDTSSVSSTPIATPNATPNGTPNTSRPTSMVDGPGIGRRGAGNSALGLNVRPQIGTTGSYGATISPQLPSSTFPGPGNRSIHSSRDAGSKFFHASDAPSAQEPAPTTTSKSTAFFYANGAMEEPTSRTMSSPSPPLSAVSGRSLRNQFLHADGSADDDNLPPIPPIPSPPKLTASPVPYQSAASPFQNMPGFRPPSPQKDNFHLSYRKGASQIIRPDNRPKAISIFPPAAFDAPRQRSISGGSNSAHLHNRTSSLSSIESVNSNRKPSLAALDTCGPTPLQSVIHGNNGSSSSSAPPSARMPSPVYENEDPMDAAGEVVKAQSPVARSRQASTSTPTIPQSPTRTNSGLPTQNLAQLTELAANARRERKVLDLEISNSSLLAINRQLEREVKKQKTEIRRFRRLSRAGRLSTRSLGTNVDGQAESAALGSISGEEEEEDWDSEEGSDDDLSASDSSSAEDTSLSPSVIGGKESRKLAKDSKRLKLDLHKHRELLVDSQRMNQSLKRCMTWTEEMILEGRRALEYQVRVSDVKLGGRVLERDVLPEEEEADYSLLSPWTPSSRPEMEVADGMLGLGLDLKVGRKSWHSEEADSGIEVESARGSALIPDGLGPQIHDLQANLPIPGGDAPS